VKLGGVRLVVVTDRRLVPAGAMAGRLAAILDGVARGAALVQVREKDLDGGALYRLVSDVIAVARPRGARVLVNDRLDVALAAGADGVHLPEAGLDVATARAVGGAGLVVGCSRHSPAAAGAAAADGADLVVLGPIWATPSKEGVVAPLGVDALAAARAAVGDRALLCAIGGVDGGAHGAAARAAGADAVAAIRALWLAGDPGAAAAALAG